VNPLLARSNRGFTPPARQTGNGLPVWIVKRTMNHQKAKHRQQLRRRNHVRRKIVGTPERPRLTVFRSSKHIYAQLVDDLSGVTLAAVSSQAKDLRGQTPYGGNVKAAAAVGAKLAEAAKGKGINLAAFDRGHYRFHGRVKALADGARKGGLQF
jgi:large subunit ribosomal protein L18